MARRQGSFDDLMEIGSKLPWQAGVSLAVASGPKADITSMNWRDFERLVAEAFRRQGFIVTGFGGSRPDGGADLGLSKNGQRFLVQCKHWRKRQVGVTVVRELNGVISAQRAHGGFVVTGGEFTREAREFERTTKIELIDGSALAELIGSNREQKNGPNGLLEEKSAPECPRCGTVMVERKAGRGKFPGKAFWGCRQYPKCSGIVQIS